MEVEAGRWSVEQAAEVLGLSVRHFWRMRAAYRESGSRVLAHGNRGRVSSRRIEEAVQVGATEICLQSGIHPDWDLDDYLSWLRLAKRLAPWMPLALASPRLVNAGFLACVIVSFGLYPFLGENFFPAARADLAHLLRLTGRTDEARFVLERGAKRDGAGVPSGTFTADRASFSKAAGDDRT